MLIRTTIRINVATLDRLTRASARMGQPIILIISSLLRRLAEDHDTLVNPWQRIKYQDRDIRENWRCYHLDLRPDEYEFFLDLRKLFKQSLSRLLVCAVIKYLDAMTGRLCNCLDNYRYRNYILSKIIIEGVICWVLYWGIPPALFNKSS